MERTLLWIAFALGWAGWLLAVLLASDNRAARDRWLPRANLVLAIGLPIAIFLLTLPSGPPWSAGQGLGRGFLLGGYCAILGYWASARSGESRHALSSAIAITAPLFISLVAVSGALIWLRADIIDTLMGIAIAWLCEAAIILAAVERPSASTTHRLNDPTTQLPNYAVTQIPLLSTGFAITLCATAALGVYRGNESFDSYAWAATAVGAAAIVPLVLLLAGIPAPFVGAFALKLPLAGLVARFTARMVEDDNARRTAATIWRIVLVDGLTLLAGWLLSAKVVTETYILYAAALGLAVGLVLWWLSPDAGERGGWPFAIRALVVLAGFMVAYRMLAGYGLGIALIAAWAITGLAIDRTDRTDRTDWTERTNRFTPPLLFGTILLLYRLFSTRFSHELRGVTLDDHYALFALILGAALPEVVAAIACRGWGGPVPQLIRLAICGAILLAVPALLTLLWGSKCALGLMFGLGLSVALSGQRLSTLNSEHSTLFAVAIALALTQWMRHAMPLSSLAREQKIHIVEWSVGAVVVLMLIADYAGRLVSKRSDEPASEGAIQ